MGFLEQALLVGPHLLVAVVLHELAHGVAAEWLGDSTARRAGRITLNPLRHIDPFLTIILPGILILSDSRIVFGGAKPVPVNFANLRNPRRDSALVAVAGPFINFVLVAVWFLSFKLSTWIPIQYGAWLSNFSALGVIMNLVLALFNLLPVPPLDGGRILVGILPLPMARVVAKLEPIGLFIVVGLLYAGVTELLLDPVVGLVIRYLESIRT